MTTKKTPMLKQAKPKARARDPVYDFSECRDFIEEKYKIDINDMSNKHDHCGTYVRATGDKALFDGKYPEERELKGETAYYIFEETGKKLNGGPTYVYVKSTKKEYDAQWKLIHEHCERFTKWEKKNPAPPYRNFWHWMLDNFEIHNGVTILFSKEHLEERKEDNVRKLAEVSTGGTPRASGSSGEDFADETWALDVYQYFLDEFANAKGEVEMETSW